MERKVNERHVPTKGFMLYSERKETTMEPLTAWPGMFLRRAEIPKTRTSLASETRVK